MRATCEYCNEEFSVSPAVAGKKIRCPACREVFRVEEYFAAAACDQPAEQPQSNQPTKEKSLPRRTEDAPSNEASEGNEDLLTERHPEQPRSNRRAENVASNRRFEESPVRRPSEETRPRQRTDSGPSKEEMDEAPFIRRTASDRKRQSKSGRDRRNSSQNLLVVILGSGFGGAVVVAIVGFFLFRSTGSSPAVATNPSEVPSIASAISAAAPDPMKQAPIQQASPSNPTPPVATVAASNSLNQAGQNVTTDGVPVQMIQRLKQSTVFIKTEIGPIGMTGSGFVMELTGDSALIVTNHHVIAKPAELKPGGYIPGLRGRDRLALARIQAALANEQPKVSVVFNSGTPNEQVIPSEILGGLPDPDLAVLRVRGIKGVPKPIEFHHVSIPVETTELYVLGFPFGDALSDDKSNPSITIGKASVSSIRKDANGRIAKIQIDGALNPGNSGGPIVDMKGDLVGVAVQTIQGTNIGLAIPPSDLVNMLDGHIGKPEIRVGKSQNGAAPTYEVVVPVADPLKKLRGVNVQFVEGSAQIDSSKSGQPQLDSIAGSSQVALNLETNLAKAPLWLTPTTGPTAREVTVQASFVNGQGLTVHLDPVVVKVAAPVVVSNESTTTKNSDGSATVTQVQKSGGRTIQRSITVGGSNKPSVPAMSDDPDDNPKKTTKPSAKKGDNSSITGGGVAVWTNKITAMRKIPDEEVTGKIDGVEFSLDRAEINGGTLTLTKNPRFRAVFAEAEVSIVLFLKANEDVSGRKYILNGIRAGDPHVRMSSMRDRDQVPNTISGFDFLVVLEFGQYDIDNRMQPGKIYVCAADRGKSYIAGTFEASVR